MVWSIFGLPFPTHSNMAVSGVSMLRASYFSHGMDIEHIYTYTYKYT
jgi:hypothetical protein